MLYHSEAYLDSSVPNDDPRLKLSGYKLVRPDKLSDGKRDDDPRLKLSGYKLVRPDKLSNGKRGGVGIYFKETLAVQPVPTNSLKECLLLEGFIGNEKGVLLSLYRLPSQSQEELDDFLFSLDQLLSNMVSQNPILLFIAGNIKIIK